MAWADGQISSALLLRNWALMCLANFVGAAGLALLVFASGHTGLNGGAIGEQVVKMALAKQTCHWDTLFVPWRIVQCAGLHGGLDGDGRTPRDVQNGRHRAAPVTAFVAAGFEHSIANMYLMPLVMLIQHFSPAKAGMATVTWAGMAGNLVPVIAGNRVGGSVLVGLAYHVIYRRGTRPELISNASIPAAPPARK